MQTVILVILVIIYAAWWLQHKDKPPDPSLDPWTFIHKPPKPPEPPRPPELPETKQHSKAFKHVPPHLLSILDEHYGCLLREPPPPPPPPPPSPYDGLLPPPPPPPRARWLEVYSPIVLCALLIGTIFIAPHFKFTAVVAIFLITMLSIFLRPREISEVYPAAVGAIIIIGFGGVSYANIMDITNKIGGASITIISTIVMAVILESFGLFHWIASKLVIISKGSGYRLYWYIQLLCFLMTLLFNNDGSILITTPILVLVLKNLGFKPHEQIPYLLSGALIATSSSAPIGVSNITNLIALNIVHMSLFTQTSMMFVPCTLGLLFMSISMFLVLKNKLPRRLSLQEFDLEEIFFTKLFHPVKGEQLWKTRKSRSKFMLKVLAFVFVIRCLIFVASYLNIPIEIVAVLGSLTLLVWRWHYLRTNPIDILRKTPWGILFFAFSMYVIIYGLNNVGLTKTLVRLCEPIVGQNLFYASMTMGGVISVMSNIFNNHPALMIGTITLTNMGLNAITIKTIYLANIIGSDIGSLLLPIGTLASLMWMFILKRNAVRVRWRDYLGVTVKVIPITVVFTLIILYLWVQAVFA